MPIEPRSAVVTIYQGDDLDRIRHLEARAEAAEEAAKEDGDRRLMEIPEYVTLAEEHQAAKDAAEKRALHVKVQAIPRRAWKALMTEHKPRDGEPLDDQWGFNWDTLPDVLVTRHGKVGEIEFQTIVGPDDFTDDDLDNLAAVDFERLFGQALALNALPGGDPKASLVSHLTQASSETSD